MGPQADDVIAKRYRLLTKLGEGERSIVFRARDLETREEVAVKVLTRWLDPELNRRLEREAVALRRLAGSCVVGFRGLGLAEDGTSYLVTDMLHGQDLEAYLARAEERGGRIKPDRLLQLFRPVVDTLEMAHAQGVFHRNLKPSNVFIVDRDHGGGTRLLDFGLAKVKGSLELTADDMVGGTPSYIAPEVWSGKFAEVDARADVYGLGMILFRTLAGRLPFATQSKVEIMVWAQRGERPRLTSHRPDLGAAIDAWVEKALAADPGARFGSVRALWTPLEAILGTPPVAPY